MEIKEYVLNRKQELKEEIEALDKKPCLCIIVVGDNPASESYVKGKMRDSDEIGIDHRLFRFDDNVTREELLSLIDKLNKDEEVDGILVQLPLPRHIDPKELQLAIDPKKDVDGFSPLTEFDACTPKGIIDYLVHEGFQFEGKNAVVIGRSDIVGKPMAKLLLAKNCNVIQVHSRTKRPEMELFLRNADLIVVATGKMHLVDDSYEFKKTAWLVDVGINRGEDKKLHGDAAPNLPLKRQTPVPGGVGLLTRLALLDNLILAYKKR